MQKKLLTYMSFMFMAVFVCFGWDGNDNVLMWQLGSGGNTVDGGPNSVYTFLGIDHADDDIGVRIAAYDRDGNLIKYLNPIYGAEGDDSSFIDWEYNDECIGTRDDLPASIRQAYFGSSSYQEYLFQMQVGVYDANFDFMELLYSRAETTSGHWYDMGTLLPSVQEWTPIDFYTINPVIPSAPEPNSFMLLTIGISLLALRRKNGIDRFSAVY